MIYVKLNNYMECEFSRKNKVVPINIPALDRGEDDACVFRQINTRTLLDNNSGATLKYVTYVQNVYNNIATHFSDTRYCIWDFVRDFMSTKSNNMKGIDIGCGNGKNIVAFPDLNILGIDNCNEFVRICRDKNINAIYGDCCEICSIDGAFDFAVAIAVYHHMENNIRREKALNEMIRILKTDGQGMFSVWSVENQQSEKINRDFTPGDNYVSWCRRGDKKIFKRYYYVYTEVMINEFMDKFKTKINIDRIYNERGNWVVVFTKI